MTIIEKKNEVFLRIRTELHIHQELAEYFSFEVPEAKFLQKQRRYKRWDGRIRLYSPGTGELHVGLFNYLTEWLQQHNYDYTVEDSKFYGTPGEEDVGVSPEAVAGFVRSLGVPFKARDYQLQSIYRALRHHRRLLLSPTGSGKSFIIYCLVRWHLQRNREILIVVPTTSLVEQLFKDFEDYGWNARHYVGKVYGGQDRYIKSPVVISTWQSIYKEPKNYFNRFDVVIGDEAHLFKAKSLTSIMDKCHDAKYRIGLTGTLDGMQSHQLQLEGVFGPVNRSIRTKDLQENGQLSELKINILVCKHPYVGFETYHDEMNYIISHEKRNKIITGLARDLNGNTLILFNYVEKHGEPLWDLLNSRGEGKKIFFVHGGVPTQEREEIRRICESSNDSIILASYGTFSTGINIKNLHNVIFASPSKSRIRNLQSIGRALRLHDSKSRATLYDFADDISNGRNRNATLNHLIERIKIYKDEKFDYSVTEIKLGGN
jgi:superfamily II DNA or RNA helicase